MASSSGTAALSSWSLSRLKTYEACAAKYDYRYNQKLPEEKSNAAIRGSGRHRQIEEYIKGTNLELPPELLFYKGFFDGLRSKSVFAEHQIALTADWKRTEWDNEGMWLRGILDLLVLDLPLKRADLFDWKTGKIYDDHEDDKELYAALVFAAYPEIENIYTNYVYVDLGKNRFKQFWRLMAPDIMRRWAERAKLMLGATEFIPNPTYACRFCGFSKWKGGPCRF